MNSPRIAWLLNSAFFYWHPALGALAKTFPNLTVFTGRWRGYAWGYDDAFAVQVVGNAQVLALSKSPEGYGTNYTALSWKIIPALLAYRPQVVFSNSFGIWTILALVLQSVGGWRVVIAYEGSSPGVDYRHAPRRLALRRLMTRLAAACITNSQAGRRYLVEILNVPGDRVFTQPYEVPNPAGLAASRTDFNFAALGLNRPVFLFVGSITPRKGLNFLLEACAILKNEGITAFSLLIVGDGEQRPELEQFCQTEGLGAIVHWVGRVPYDQVGAFFSDADGFILPTLEDTWGVVVSEAMVLGKAVLCSQWAGAIELIEPGQTGYGFDPRQPAQLAALMKAWIAAPEQMQQMGQQAQAQMAQYSPAIAGQFLATVTHTVLNSP